MFLNLQAYKLIKVSLLSRKNKQQVTTRPVLDRFNDSSRVVPLICLNLLKISSVDFVQNSMKLCKSLEKHAKESNSKNMQSVLKYAKGGKVCKVC
jgi:hypothetical protein